MRFAREADENTQLQEALASVVFYKLDADKGEGAELADQFLIKGYPTYVVINAEGATISRWGGYENPASFTELLARAVADPTTIEEKRARYEETPSLEDAVTLAEYHESRGEFQEAVDYFESAREMKGPEGGFEYELFLAYRWGLEEEAFGIDEVRAAADQAMSSGHLSDKQFLRLARLMSMAAEEDADWSVAPYIERALAATETMDDPELENERRHVLIEQALRVTHDHARALELALETRAEGWQDDPGELNGFAWWCFENRINLEQAEELARRGADLASAGGQKAMVLDTLAELVFLRGATDEAVELIRQAIEQDPENEYYQKQLVRFGGEPEGTM
jgi:tetratricopeptide (TPR) repeat protein